MTSFEQNLWRLAPSLQVAGFTPCEPELLFNGVLCGRWTRRSRPSPVLRESAIFSGVCCKFMELKEQARGLFGREINFFAEMTHRSRSERWGSKALDDGNHRRILPVFGCDEVIGLGKRLYPFEEGRAAITDIIAFQCLRCMAATMAKVFLFCAEAPGSEVHCASGIGNIRYVLGN